MSVDQPTNPLGQIGNGAGDFGGVGHADAEDLTLYAMQLLTGDDAATVAGHLEHCAECREEVARVRGDLALYALTAEMHAVPSTARQHVMAQVAREKREPPPVPVPIPVAVATPALASFGRSGSLLASDEEEEEKPKRNIGMAIFGWSGWAIAAGLAVVAAGLYKDRGALRDNLASRTSQVQRLNEGAASAHQLMDALTDPKALRVTLTAKPQPKAVPIGGVTYSPEKATLVFLANNLDPLEQNKTYELWLIPADGGAPIPAGTFHPNEVGSASVIMPDLPKGIAAKAFGVTVEPDGGSQTPTMPIVMAGS